MTIKLEEETKARPKQVDPKTRTPKSAAKPAQAAKKPAVKHAKLPASERQQSRIAKRTGQIRSTLQPSPASALRRVLGLSQPEFARLFPVSLRTLVTMESGARMTEPQVRRLNELTRLTNALAEVIRKESLGPWLKEPNSAFEGLKPVEVIERGEVDRIWSMIYFLRSGVPS
jgi:DNA-binding transcriptional regulator YiaG